MTQYFFAVFFQYCHCSSKFIFFVFHFRRSLIHIFIFLFMKSPIIHLFSVVIELMMMEDAQWIEHISNDIGSKRWRRNCHEHPKTLVALAKMFQDGVPLIDIDTRLKNLKFRFDPISAALQNAMSADKCFLRGKNLCEFAIRIGQQVMVRHMTGNTTDLETLKKMQTLAIQMASDVSYKPFMGYVKFFRREILKMKKAQN